jgi:RNA polymerase sigma-70 factor (ECF subfamily)
MPAHREGVDTTLERFRSYLSILAQVNVDPRLRGKLDLSGVVQQTLLEAYQALAQLQAWTEAQRAAWLRRALANNLTDEIRRLRTDKRDVGREQSLEEEALAESSARVEAWLQAEQSSPSQQAQRHERELRLAQALEQLPPAEREVLVLQHWQHWTLAQIAAHTGRTEGSVAGLIHRALDRLRPHLSDLA